MNTLINDKLPQLSKHSTKPCYLFRPKLQLFETTNRTLQQAHRCTAHVCAADSSNYQLLQPNAHLFW